MANFHDANEKQAASSQRTNERKKKDLWDPRQQKLKTWPIVLGPSSSPLLVRWTFNLARVATPTWGLIPISLHQRWINLLAIAQRWTCLEHVWLSFLSVFGKFRWPFASILITIHGMCFAVLFDIWHRWTFSSASPLPSFALSCWHLLHEQCSRSCGAFLC